MESDRRMTDTRQRILQCARALYTAGGYEKMNFQSIAEQLHVSKPSLFYHFKNKQELFYEVLLSLIEEYHEMFLQVIHRGDSSIRATLRRIMQQLAAEPRFDMMRFWREEFNLLAPQQRQIVSEAWQKGLLEVIIAILEDGVARQELRTFQNPLHAYAFLHLCLLLPQPEHPGKPRLLSLSLEETIDALLILFLEGLGIKKG
ncbi:MAG TPA: TetR/AcrR family transcriptional regulator [Ktedonobacteraceae bacterium]|nr:TetR/AcrR family transcriptional regulator [Ktedonobacteraceae bacterium]